MKKENLIDVWMVSRVSVFLNQSCDTEMDNVIYWLTDNGEVELDFNKKELRFIDWVGDDKTYFSLVGVATMNDKFKTGDYFTEKN